MAIEATQSSGRDVVPAARLPRLAATGAVVGGLAALSCCVLPLAFVAVGISGAWISNLTALSPYQPWFILGALTAVGIGFWRARQARTACATGTVCTKPMPRRLVNGALWTGLVLIAVAVSINLIVPLVLG